jgi:pyruvate dehydrogenase E1 component alpha subunit
MQAYQQAKIGGFCHIYSGRRRRRRAAPPPSSTRPDRLAYRDHGHALARGHAPRRLHGRDVRQARGLRQGQGRVDAHVRPPNNLFGGHGIVGAQTPLGRARLRRPLQVGGLENGPKQVCLCFLGDGAIDQGAFHEAKNLAASSASR